MQRYRRHLLKFLAGLGSLALFSSYFKFKKQIDSGTADFSSEDPDLSSRN